MNPTLLREQLHKQIDRLPDDLLEQMADFVFFLLAKKHGWLHYEDWEDRQWQEFALEQFLEDDEVTYTLSEAKEIYRRP